MSFWLWGILALYHIHQNNRCINGRRSRFRLNQLRMPLNRFLNPLRLNANIPLCNRCAAMLQQSLHQRNIVSIGFINLRGAPFVQAMVRLFLLKIFYI